MSDEEETRKPAERLKSEAEKLSRLNAKELALAVRKMNIGQKKHLALTANAGIRRLLLRDSNPDIQLAVVKSPKASESEIVQLSGMPSTAEIVLKTISDTGRWMKCYRVKHNLAKNPKTPTNIANRCLRGLTKHDLKKISQDANLPKSITLTAKRLLTSRR